MFLNMNNSLCNVLEKKQMWFNLAVEVIFIPNQGRMSQAMWLLVTVLIAANQVGLGQLSVRLGGSLEEGEEEQENDHRGTL